MDKQNRYDILIASPNSALDSYYELDALKRCAVNRAVSVRYTAGGKGFNMARAAVNLGGSVLGLGIVGGFTGQAIAQELENEGIPHELVWSAAESRRCSTILIKGDPDSTVVLEPGSPVGEEAREKFVELVLRRSQDAPYLVLIGSLPPDIPADFYAGLINSLKQKGVKVCLDSSGLALRLAGEAGPAMIKVNKEEFLFAFGPGPAALNDEWQIMGDIFSQLAEKGVETLIVTDGANGAYAFSRERPPIHINTQVDEWTSSAGAGDSFLAGLLVALNSGESLPEAARYASAVSAANLQQLGCGFFAREDVGRYLKLTQVKELNLSKLLEPGENSISVECRGGSRTALPQRS